jgi:hypothetical protein
VHYKLAELNGGMIDILPELAYTNRQNARNMVEPVRKSCTELRQFSRTLYEDVTGEADVVVK